MDWAVAGLWMAVVFSGVYHGVNPAMGWPLAVSAALMDRQPRSLVMAFWPLAIGHLLAMLVVLLPFAVLITLFDWQQEIRITAALVVLGFGVFQLLMRPHPRLLSRIPPSQLGVWSFMMATAHGAGLMIVPIYLGLCTSDAVPAEHEAAQRLLASDLSLGGIVALLHTLSMVLSGAIMAWLTYRYLGLKFITRAWFNLDTVWALSFIAAGGISLALALA